MKLSLNWLRRYVALDRPVEEISNALTMIGFEVEGIVRTGLAPMANVVVGEILTRDKHPGADKLSVCTVRIAPEGAPTQIVCGAPNCDAGHRVPVALPGAVMPGDFKIKVSKIRGVESNGMMCSARELGLGEDAGGLLVLPGSIALGTPIHEALGAGDVVFDLEITPNRPDCLSHLGLARELAAWFRLPLQYPEIRVKSPATHGVAASHLLESVAVTAEEDCPHYTAHVVAGVKIGPSPAWLQEALQAVGLRPINNVVDVTNFVLLETGQPLHAFDAKKIAGHRLVIRRAGDGEKLVTLDNKERTLNGRMLVIADAEKPLVVAGIMGGASAEVDPTTTDLVLESAYFKPTGIRWTSKKLGLSSDSAYRFERGIDPCGVLDAARRALDLILETAGGHVVGPLFKVGGEPATETAIEVTPEFIRRRAGYDIPDTAMRGILESIELEVEQRLALEAPGFVWTVKVPSWRGDLDRPVDLVEEVVRLYGCDKIPPAPVVAVALPEADDPISEFNRAATAYLVGQHFFECINYSQRSGPETAAWVSEAAAQALALANPFTEEYSHLRASLINGLLDNLRLNQDRRTGATKLFEVGRTFREQDGKIYECLSVGFLICTTADETQWLPRAAADFYTAKRHLTVVAANAGVALENLRVEPVAAANAGWQPGHSATFGRLTDGCEARCGLLNLEMLRKLGLTGGVVAGILHLLPEKAAVARPRAKFKAFSLFPPALRDVALVVDEAAAAETVRRDVAKAARAAVVAGKFVLENVRLFDVYRGTGLPEGKKSFAFSLVYRAEDRTLTDDEVNVAFQKTQDELAKNAAYAIRK
ncbi:MAG: phenylalanine--tRNA ligase subunit beta [Opitutaceae bacterium]|nr:phenylalanine--tRNA ligase subunit beta [Opitutaceae bacterium]